MKLEQVAKYIFLLSGLLIVLVGLPRFILNTWLPYTNYVFYFALILAGLAVVFSYKKIIEVFSMRTTKYGMNMGSLVILGLLLYLCLNFFAFRYEKSIDITSDQLNSLSLQSLEIIDKLDQEVTFKVFYQGEIHKNENIGLKLLFKKYQRESSKIKYEFVDAYKDLSSGKFLNREDKGKVVVYALKGGRRERVKEPITEESLTSALYRLESTELKKIYFLNGHGERSINQIQSDGSGLKLLVSALKEKGFSLEGLSLSQTQSVPRDASMLALVGPKKELLDQEVEALKSYVQEGGRLFVALDPTQNVKLAALGEFVGIAFDGNYLLSTQAIAGADALTVLGQDFSKQKVTSDFEKNAITLYYEASSLTDLKGSLNSEVLVKTPQNVIPVQNIENYQEEVKGQNPQSLNLVILVEGSFPEEAHQGHHHGEGEIPQTAVIWAGDSDFLSDIYFETGFNKDLVLNMIAYLAGQSQLVSIRPNAAKNTKMVLTSADSAFILLFALFLPLLLLIVSLVLWFRRRGA